MGIKRRNGGSIVYISVSPAIARPAAYSSVDARPADI